MPWENKRIDPWIPILVCLLMSVGLIAIKSSTRDISGAFVMKQIIWDLIGVSFLFLAVFVRERDIDRSLWMVYGVTIFLLSAVLYWGVSTTGSRRWFDLGVGYFQPSELAKLAVILISARLLSKGTRRVFWVSSLFIAPVIFLILLEPDFGTAFLVGMTWFVMSITSPVPWRSILIVLLIIAILLPFGYFFVLKDYQRERLMSFLYPERYSQSGAYNVLQSIHAIGSGGLFGRGYLRGPATLKGYVPKKHTDFILSVVGEEFGLGVATLIFLFVLLIYRIQRSVRRAKNLFWELVCVGVATVLAFHIFENMAMTMGLAPVTGIPLPFVSYGGSSTLMFCVMLGLVMKANAIGKTGKEVKGG
ncbi:MAG: rod shape-determining protein RodA [Thermotogae bacterium]|nr:MAG: rod shape-determining protein RodA [Thermotogota bacterium]